ncbi:extracellular solute-binding protein [Alteribacillus sp. HJP-4]|uniref:extracellular solute-binding protein n=1 Tax=Alteribacillus sp. HJP-4 TaxID=2775394 RepID=UPI0035CD21DE
MRRLVKKKNLALPFLFLFLCAFLAGCSEDSNQDSEASDTEGEEAYDISVMTTAYTPEPPDENSPAWQTLEEYTNTNLDITFVPSSNWDERFNVTLASGDMPKVMLADKTPSFINAVQDGAFWDLTEYIEDYENLSQMNEITQNNISIEGKIYGLYRSRPLGRNAVTIRKDWLENVGMDMPETTEEFYEVLTAFKEDDPNGTGEDDTLGMTVSEYEGPWDVMQTWFGVPNKWGETDNGELEPHFMFPQYIEALDYFHQMYEDGLVNEDFAVMDPANWHEMFVTGEAGVVVDVGDAANRNQNDMISADPELEDTVDVFGAVEGPEGLFTLPTTGYNSMFAIPKTSVETEEDLHKVLEFMDQLSTEEGQTLAHNGVEGEHYEIEDGDYVPTTDQNKVYEYEDLNQLLTFIPEDRFLVEPETEILKKGQDVMEANEDIVVANPAEPLISEVYATRGQQLDDIIADARIKYIVGQIDENGLEEAEDLWLSSGGQDYIEEINTLYKESQN